MNLVYTLKLCLYSKTHYCHCENSDSSVASFKLCESLIQALLGGWGEVFKYQHLERLLCLSFLLRYTQLPRCDKNLACLWLQSLLIQPLGHRVTPLTTTPKNHRQTGWSSSFVQTTSHSLCTVKLWPRGMPGPLLMQHILPGGGLAPLPGL